MEIRWGRSKSNPRLTNESQVREDAAQTISEARRHASLMDDIVAEHQRNGGFDNLEGKGKPLDLSGEITENYYLHRVLKQADVLPPWLELQHEIRDRIRKLMDDVDSERIHDVKQEIENINQKIKKYNGICPSSWFEKPRLTPQTYRQQITRWE